MFPAELPVFLKEHKLGMYRTSVYLICKMTAEVRPFFKAYDIQRHPFGMSANFSEKLTFLHSDKHKGEG